MRSGVIGIHWNGPYGTVHEIVVRPFARATSIADWSDCAYPIDVYVAPEIVWTFALCAVSASLLRRGTA